MDPLDLIQAITAGICFYAGIVHLMTGLRSEPKDRVHITFALLSLLFGVYSVGIFFLVAAVDTGSLTYYVSIDKLTFLAYYLAIASLIWFIAAYTNAGNRFIPMLLSGLYILIAFSSFFMSFPVTWIYTDIVLNPTFPPDIVVSPWYSVEQVFTWLVLLIYTAYYAAKQYRRGEKEAATALAIAMGIYLFTVLWDYGIEYGMIDTVLIQQYGFIAFIVIMSLRLSGQAVEAEKEARRLNIELEDRVAERTADLSAAKESAEAANRAKSIFLANMSHELRTPLNAILGFTQLMERDPDTTPRQMEQLETINRSGEHLLDLINAVLDMSRIEAGRLDLDPSNFDLYQSLESLESFLRVRAEDMGLDLVFEVDNDVPRYIRTDQGKLRQVLINLLGNAIKFTEEGRVVLRVSSSENSLYFEVEDTGFGIDATEMDRLFEPFSQTQSGHQLAEGTGLGLPISRQFVQLLGGDISVKSKPGQGSTFAFDIVYETVDPVETILDRPDRRVTGLAPSTSPCRILVVDDSTENRLLLQQMLEGVGFNVRTATNGRDAFTEYKTWQPHLIWMDIRMPVMDGYEATRLIRASDGPETKIIAITASVFEEEQAQILAAGCDGFVRKPFQEAEIFEIMAEHLGVEYVYETAEAQWVSGSQTALSADDLASFPDDWLEALRGAATRGRTEELLELIAQIEPQHPLIAGALREMVGDLVFQQIVALTEVEASHESSAS